jgi:hypothetical protein
VWKPNSFVWFPRNIIICGLVVCEVSLVTTQYNNMWNGGLWSEFGTKPPVHILLHCVVTKLTSLNDQFHILIYCVETKLISQTTSPHIIILRKWVWFPHNIIICGLVVCEVSLISTQYNNMWTGGLWNEFGFHTIY